MAIDPNEIKTAVDMLGADDRNTDGTPKIEAVRRLCGNDTITAEEITAALASPEGNGGDKVTTDTAAPANIKSAPALDLATLNKPAVQTTQAAPPSAPPAPATQAAPPPAPPAPATQAADEGDKEESIGDAEDDRNALIARQVALAKQEKDALQANADNLARERERINLELAKLTPTIDKLAQVIEEGTVQLSEAEMVKKIQAQTQARLMKQHEDAEKVKAALASTGIKNYASPLDAALAAGAKRSVVLIDGKPFAAPHPRSPEGVRSYANWVHNGSRQSA